MSQKQVMPKSDDLSRSLEINAIWTFDTEFPTIFNKSCTYITFKSADNYILSTFHILGSPLSFCTSIFDLTWTYIFIMHANAHNVL